MLAAGAAAVAAGTAMPAVAPPLAGAATVYAPRVWVMVAGRTRILKPPTPVAAGPVSVAVAGRRCAVAAGTPLAALEATRRLRGPTYSLRDYGGCSARPADSGGLFVFRIGGDYNRGQDGWVYKVDRRAGTTGAGELRGPFGNGQRLRPGQRLTWFYCHMGAHGCQASLEVQLGGTRLAAGATVSVSVRGYDDFARSHPVAGAVVRLGGVQAVTGPDGAAALTAPGRGRYAVTATALGAVPAFPVGVTIG